ncbi:MAG TPA: methyltransferase domain-containing protein [Candidatus Angelobacter sp.]|jgi:ubiquinone/menaquinone biosynthesis C-methylase UbiE|nr:methyltransferase domain-containing protein [Candidatus Angelobacter sp.]
MSSTADWNSFGRVNASQRWRKQSAAMGSGMTEAIVAAAKIQSGQRVLDVACGTGEPAISIASLLQGRGEVVGVDISPAPLEIARQRARNRNLKNVQFEQCDAHRLSFPDRSFDRVTSRLGIMFFEDLPKALREMHRVLKPGGRVALLAWGVMEQPYIASTIGTLLRVLPGAEIPAVAKKMFAFGQHGLLAAKLRAAGFSGVEEKFLTVPWTWPGTPEEVWEYFKEVTIPFAPLLKSVPPEQQEAVDKAVTTAIAQYAEGREVKFTAKVNITTAEK